MHQRAVMNTIFCPPINESFLALLSEGQTAVCVRVGCCFHTRGKGEQPDQGMQMSLPARWAGL